MKAPSCLTMTSQPCSLMLRIQVPSINHCREGLGVSGELVLQSNAPLSQGPVTTLSSEQRPPEEFGNYGFPAYNLQPKVEDQSPRLGPCP